MKEIDTFLIRIKKNMQICSNYLKSNSIVDLIRIGLNTFSENMEIIRQLKQPDMKLETENLELLPQPPDVVCCVLATSGVCAFGETPQPGGGTDIEAAAVEGRRGHDGFAEFVACEDFETVGSLQHHAHSRLREDADLVAGCDRRSIVVA